MGGLYAAPFGFQWLLYDFEARIPELEAPGIKVLHVPELDYDTTCQTLVECLAVVKDWSDARPGHLPIMILIEAKDDLVPDPLDLDFTVPIEFGPAEFDDLDAEIRSVFPPEQLITPDDVRGECANPGGGGADPGMADAVRSSGANPVRPGQRGFEAGRLPGGPSFAHGARPLYQRDPWSARCGFREDERAAHGSRPHSRAGRETDTSSGPERTPTPWTPGTTTPSDATPPSRAVPST